MNQEIYNQEYLDMVGFFINNNFDSRDSSRIKLIPFGQDAIELRHKGTIFMVNTLEKFGLHGMLNNGKLVVIKL